MGKVKATKSVRPTRAGRVAAPVAARKRVNGEAHASRVNGDDPIAQFRAAVARVVPKGATVTVVSRGDQELLKIAGRTAWHFPRRADGVYAGYYPSDGAAAVNHLQTLQARGAQYIAFPDSAFWWLEHYQELQQHLDARGTLLAQDDACIVYALRATRAGAAVKVHPADAIDGETDFDAERRANDPLCAFVAPEFVDDLRGLFDLDHYCRQAGAFANVEQAMAHYVERGAVAGHDPHPLFHTRDYLDRYAHVRSAGVNPLLHFVTRGVFEALDPNPYFDTDYYYSQDPGLRDQRINALVHYVEHVFHGRGHAANPLLSDRYYLTTYPDVKRTGLPPLAHFLSIGAAEGRTTSHAQKEIRDELLRPTQGSLVRGGWRSGTVLLFSAGDTAERAGVMLDLARTWARDHHLMPCVIFRKRPHLAAETLRDINAAALDDFESVGDVSRPAALRLLLRTLRAAAPLFAVSDDPHVVASLNAEGIDCHFLCNLQIAQSCTGDALAPALNQASRTIFDSSAAFHTAAKKAGFYPARVAVREQRQWPSEVLELARADFKIPENAPVTTIRGRVVIPCCDWHLSGVHSAVEAVGEELIRLGFDVQILFTRDRATVAKSVCAEGHLPRIPYHYLGPAMPGPSAMWEALIGHLERSAPSVMFCGYDFLANAVTPALSDRVGVVAWVQSDDGDYYEQAYRLGRYCNALVCVSERICKQVAALNPVIGEHSVVIHNSSVRRQDVADERPAIPARRRRKMRLIYTGRLVQYQKRILDFIDLACALDGAGVPYELTLAGDFSTHEDATRELFETRAAAHLADGRIRLPGRLRRDEILEQLSANDFFVLLSDFEGLPLSLVEAMARGCVPVTAEMHSGIPEAITHGQDGLIMQGRDYGAWAQTLATLWRDAPRMASMSKRARATVLARFTVEHVANQLAELLDRVLGDITAGRYQRPAALHWGHGRSPTGDVLPPPWMYKPHE